MFPHRVSKSEMISHIVDQLQNDSDFAGVSTIRLTLAVDKALTSHVLAQVEAEQVANLLKILKCSVDLLKLKTASA